MIRHSRAKLLDLPARNDREVHAEITDDGRGKPGGENPGSGLSGLAERVAGFGRANSRRDRCKREDSAYA